MSSDCHEGSTDYLGNRLDDAAVDDSKCKLCEYTRCGNYKFTEIMNYVPDNIHDVHIDELCSQVRANLELHLQLSLSFDQVKIHFLNHQCDQKVILNNILRELIPLVSAARCTCVATQDNMSIVDPKSTAMYLDTVKQVMGIYKHLDGMKGCRKPA